MDRLPEDVLAWSGNHASIVEASGSDLTDLARRRPTVVGNLEADAMTLIGPSVVALLEDEG